MRVRIRAIALIVATVVFIPFLRAADTLPSALPDSAFWEMSSSFSEKAGTFAFEMFMSNEVTFQTVIPDLVRQAPQNGVYLGVAPEQNFTYIAALRPKMAFIIDIRRENLIEMLMYKALFEMSANRGEFLSRLFSRRLQPGASGLDPQASADRLFDAMGSGSGDKELFAQNLRSIKDRLQKLHAFPLTSQDLQTLDYIYSAFLRGGPNAHLTTYGTSYRLLMRETDGRGRNWNYLASESNFQFVKQMQQKNLIVPVVGDFAGPKAIRAVARYIQDHNAVVSGFYVSNVEEYIESPRSVWSAYCGNVATLPVTASSLFIRFGRGGRGSFLGSMQPFIKRGCS